MAKRAEDEIDILMPGYTHLQKAQPVRWSHWLLRYIVRFTYIFFINFEENYFFSHAWAVHEDRERLSQIAARTMRACPLGSGALAGTPLNIDRNKVASSLGFEVPSENSMHAVADRDFVGAYVCSDL